MSFDWRTEETIQWDEPPQSEPDPEPAPKRRWWRWGMVAFLLLCLGGLAAAFLLLRQRIETNTALANNDLLASHELISSAAEDGDAELVATFLSGRDRQWSAAIEKAVLEGNYQNREAFGLTWLPTDPATAVISATLNPQFNAAEVTFEQLYAFPVGNGLTDTVRLQQTAVYRLGPDRWLLAPPDEEFWGETKTKEGFYLRLEYPTRDEAVAQRLALDLDTAMAALCASSSLYCPENIHLQVEFSTDPLSLSPQQNSAIFVNDHWLLRVPTPTLVGLPQDQMAYQVLSRGYKAQLAGTVMRLLSGVDTGVQGPFLDAWLAWQLDQLAVRPYPFTPADRQTLAEQSVSLQTGEELWYTGREADLFAYAFIEFLIEDLHVNPQRIVDTLALNVADPYEDWILGLTDNRFTFSELESRWQEFLDETTSPLPERSLPR